MIFNMTETNISVIKQIKKDIYEIHVYDIWIEKRLKCKISKC